MPNARPRFAIWSLVGLFAVFFLWGTALQAVETAPRQTAAAQHLVSGVPAEELVQPPVRAMLGVLLANQHGCVIVTSLYVGGPADRAGLQVGDQIITLNGQEVISDAHLLRLLDGQQPNDRVNLLIRRGVWTNHFVVTLGASNIVSTLPTSPDAAPLANYGPFGYKPRRRGTIDGRRAMDIYDPYLRALNTDFGP
jgi:predicted metalloprotease with PDZ domain